MPENLYQDVLGDLRIAWDAHHQWYYVELMYQDWQRELPQLRDVIDQAYHAFEAEIKPFAPADPLAELRETFEHQMAWLEHIERKHDLSQEGEREFRTAMSTARIAFNDLYEAQQRPI